MHGSQMPSLGFSINMMAPMLIMGSHACAESFDLKGLAFCRV